MSRKNLFVLSFIILSIFSYILYKYIHKQDINPPNISQINVNIDIIRLDQKIFDKNKVTKEEIVEILKDNPDLTVRFLETEYKESKIDSMASFIYQVAQYEQINILRKEIARIYKDMTPLIHELERAFKFIKYYFPKYKVPKVYSFITGYNHEVFCSDKIIVFDPSYYLGQDSKHQPTIPDYILQRHTPANLPKRIIYELSNSLLKYDKNDKTLLNDMISYGKRYLFIKHTMPNLLENQIFDYSVEQAKFVHKNETAIWAYLLENKSLFKKELPIKMDFMGESPFNCIFGPKCPGNLGAWLGYRILLSYQKNNKNESLSEIMQNPNSQEIFQKSRYTP